jgi:TLC domain
MDMFESNESIVFHPLIMLAGWTTLFGLARLVCRRYSRDFANRLVSLVHCAVGISAPFFVLDFANLRTNVGTPNTPEQLKLLLFSLGYFVYDMVCCLWIEMIENRLDLATAFHHVVTILGLVVGVSQGISGHELLLCLVLMEVSSPFLHLRYMLREIGLGSSRMASYNDIAFALSFLVCRDVLALPVVYWTVVSSTTPLLVKAGGLGVLLVSLFWTGKLLSILKRKVFGAGKRASDPKAA